MRNCNLHLDIVRVCQCDADRLGDLVNSRNHEFRVRVNICVGACLFFAEVQASRARRVWANALGSRALVFLILDAVQASLARRVCTTAWGPCMCDGDIVQANEL